MFRIFSLFVWTDSIYRAAFRTGMFAVVGNVFYVARREHCFYLQYDILDT